MTDASEQIVALIKSGQKIAAIKLLREEDGLSLVDAKAQVEAATEALKSAGELPADFGARRGCGAALLLLGVLSLLLVAIL
jgi:hypothetical protein